MKRTLTFAEKEKRLRDIFDPTSELYKRDKLRQDRYNESLAPGTERFLCGPTPRKVGDRITSKGVVYEVVSVSGAFFDAKTTEQREGKK